MSETIIGYARCSADEQDLTAQPTGSPSSASDDRIYLDHGLTGTTRARPGLDQVLAADRSGDTLVVSKLDRLARSVPDARLRRVRSRPAADQDQGGHSPGPREKLRDKQPKLSTQQQHELVRMYGTADYTIADLAEVFTVSRTTVYRTLQRDQTSAKAR